jgi:hypothetical protein
VVDEPLTVHPISDSDRTEEIDRPLLEDASAQTALDVRAIAPLDDHGVDALAVQQMPEREPRRSGADDRDLRAGGPVACHAG